MRRVIQYRCEGDAVTGTLDLSSGATGVLIVSGGNEIRVGAHRGMAMLAARLAAKGVPVFRYDRRGVGDSEGDNRGFGSSGPDIAEAAAAFRAAAPGVSRIVGFGNCDAATALALFHRAAGIDALVLANPWLGHQDDGLPPPAAIRARYVERLRDPASWVRLLRGGIHVGKLLEGLRKIMRPASAPPLAARIAAALKDSVLTLVLARGDATALGFAEAWRAPVFDSVRARAAVVEVPTDSHSFAGRADAKTLEATILAAIG